MQESDRFESEVDAVGESLGDATSLATAFAAVLNEVKAEFADTSREARVLSSGINRGLRNAFDGLVFDGLKLSDALTNLAQSMVNAAYNAAMRPVTSHFGNLLGTGIEGLIQGVGSFAQAGTTPLSQAGTPPKRAAGPSGVLMQSAKAAGTTGGGDLSHSSVSRFSGGTVASFATGEALGTVSGASGRGAAPVVDSPFLRALEGRQATGSRGGGAGPVQVVMNITTPDADSFRRSQSQIAAQMSRALSRGQRNR